MLLNLKLQDFAEGSQSRAVSEGLKDMLLTWRVRLVQGRSTSSRGRMQGSMRCREGDGLYVLRRIGLI